MNRSFLFGLGPIKDESVGQKQRYLVLTEKVVTAGRESEGGGVERAVSEQRREEGY